MAGPVCDNVILDAVPPLVDAPYVSIDSGSVVNRREVSLNFHLNSLEDPDAIQLLVSNSGSFYDASWQSYSSRITWYISGDDGEKTIYVKYRDLAGNISPASGSNYYAVNLTLDTTPPEIYSFIPLVYYSRFVTIPVRLNIGDNLSPHIWVSLSEDPDLLGDNWQLYSNNMTYTIGKSEGSHTIYIVAKDWIGNLSSREKIDVVYDTVSPEDGWVEIDNGSAYSADPGGLLALNLSSFDDGSGLDMMYISENPFFIPRVSTSYSPTFNYILSRHGVGLEKPVTLYVKYKDRAGNWSNPVSDTIFYDTRPPSPVADAEGEYNFFLFNGDCYGGRTTKEVYNGGYSYAVTEGGYGSNWECFAETPVLNWNAVEGSVHFVTNYKFGSGDKGYFEYRGSEDEFTWDNWTHLVTFTTSSGGWKKERIQLNGLERYRKIQFRFHFISDSTGDPSGKWLFDNFYISGPFYTLNNFVINGGSEYTNDREIYYSLNVTGARYMSISEQENEEGSWKDYQASGYYTIQSAGDGLKEIYVKVRDAAGNEVGNFHDSIVLDTTPPSPENLQLR